MNNKIEVVVQVSGGKKKIMEASCPRDILTQLGLSSMKCEVNGIPYGLDEAFEEDSDGVTLVRFSTMEKGA